ncbi:unnamed protein product [Cochlearia groenlandica]
MDHAYKSQLQSLTMKQNMDLPVYVAEREGPAHAPGFRCRVTACGQTFQSPEFFPTLKAAEHSAAKLALASLAPLNPEASVDVAYKNLLQEIAQKSNSPLPVYATATSGPSHSPSFTSSVEIAGTLFQGDESKTKKLAETSAAKVAFFSITNGRPNHTPSPSLPCERQEAADSNLKNIVQEIPSRPSNMVTPDVPSKWIQVYEHELPDVLNAPANNVKKMNVATSHVPENPTDNCSLKAQAINGKEMNIAAAADSLHVHENPRDGGSPKAQGAKESEMNIATSSEIMGENPTTKDGKESVEEMEKKLKMGSGHMSMASGQHVVCRPWKAGMSLPQGAEMLFRDDRFIAYRLLNQEEDCVSI